jgi:hypothetical protein
VVQDDILNLDLGLEDLMNSDDDFVRRDDVVWEERSQCCAAPQEDENCGELDSTFISCLPEPDNVAGERQ